MSVWRRRFRARPSCRRYHLHALRIFRAWHAAGHSIFGWLCGLFRKPDELRRLDLVPRSVVCLSLREKK